MHSLINGVLSYNNAWYGQLYNNCQDILLYIQQDAMLHSLFCIESALHVLGGSTTRTM